MAGDGTVGSTGTVGRVADTQMGEADALGSVGAIFSATSEGGNDSVCEADTEAGLAECFGLLQRVMLAQWVVMIH